MLLSLSCFENGWVFEGAVVPSGLVDDSPRWGSRRDTT